MSTGRHTSESAGLGASEKLILLFQTEDLSDTLPLRRPDRVLEHVWVVQVLYFSWILQVVSEVKLVLRYPKLSLRNELQPV